MDTGVVTIQTDTVVTNTIPADVASRSGAQTLKATILAAATTASDAYRLFLDALAQAADANDVAGLQAAVTTMKSALDAFMSTLPRG